MAFLINPYNAYGRPDDIDGDYIIDLHDVCIYEHYYEAYHQECLSEAGVYFVGDCINLGGILLDVIANPFIPREIKEWLREQIERLQDYVNVSVIDTFPEAQISTCAELEGFAGNYYDTADMYERMAKLMFNIAEEVGTSRLPPKIRALIVTPLLIVGSQASRKANRYRRAGLAAQTAHANLCLLRWIMPPIHE